MPRQLETFLPHDFEDTDKFLLTGLFYLVNVREIFQHMRKEICPSYFELLHNSSETYQSQRGTLPSVPLSKQNNTEPHKVVESYGKCVFRV